MSAISRDASQSVIPCGNQPAEVVPVGATYSKLTDRLRRAAAGGLSCRLFCGGTGCKYESAEKWTAEDQAIPGLYSHWVTEFILAMARPSTALIQQQNLMEKFKRAGITSVFNVQQRGEHAHCGPGLDPSSGFTYATELFMEHKIYFYNFEWEDFHAPDLSQLLDVVKVLCFAVTQGRAAVHCHAGLGRTGALIACYLVFQERMNPSTAIRHVREKRPGSIQTSVQVEVVKAFSEYLLPMWTIFPSSNGGRFTFEKQLANQRQVSHGNEYCQYKKIPKIVAILCHRLSELLDGISGDPCMLQAVTTWCEEHSCAVASKGLSQSCTPPPCSDSKSSIGWHCLEPKDEMEQYSPHHSGCGPGVHVGANHTGAEAGKLTCDMSCDFKGSPSHLCTHGDHGAGSYDSWGVSLQRAMQVKHLKTVANSQSNWSSITSESDAIVLFQLLVDWLWDLKEPMLSPSVSEEQEVTSFLESCEGRDSIVVEPSKSQTIHCLKQMINKIQHNGLMKKVAATVRQSLYQKCVSV